MRKKLKKIPYFKTEQEEDTFWQKADSTEYVDYSKATRGFPYKVKLSTRPITIRLTESVIDQLKKVAAKMDVPYQSLIKQILYLTLNKKNASDILDL